MNLDWKRFITDLTIDFVRHEVDPLRQVNPELPITTNFMETFEGLNYFKFADELDVVSWDATQLGMTQTTQPSKLFCSRSTMTLCVRSKVVSRSC